MRTGTHFYGCLSLQPSLAGRLSQFAPTLRGLSRESIGATRGADLGLAVGEFEGAAVWARVSESAHVRV